MPKVTQWEVAEQVRVTPQPLFWHSGTGIQARLIHSKSLTEAPAKGVNLS